MKTNKFQLVLLLAILLCAKSMMSQSTLLNLKYITYNGTTDTVNNAPILIDANGKVVVSGNKKVSATQYDAITAQQLTNGIMTWTNSFNLSTQKAWVTRNYDDGYSGIYVTGGVATGTTNGIDLFVIKYDYYGTPLWAMTYNGPNSTTDIGTGITTDLYGYVYVCGASDGTLGALTDFTTLQLDGSTGNQMWESRYNYANSIDVPTDIYYDYGIAGLVVSGYSGSTYNDWDFVAVSYDIYGSQLDETRIANPGGGQDKAFSMASDTLGNVYITGTIANGLGSYDVQTTKLDTGLNVVWTSTIDVNGYDDAGINVALDDSLNVYVTGVAYYNGTNRNLLVLKYDKNGILKWKVQKRPPAAGSDAEGVRVKVKNNNEIFVGGNFTNGGNQDLALLRYDSLGRQTMEKTYNGATNSTDKFLDMVLQPDSNFIFVSARTYSTGSLDANITLKYEYRDYTITPVTNTTTGINSSGGEVIIKFYKKCMKMTNINDKNLLFGKLSDFVEDSTCAKITSVLPAGTMTFNAANFAARKIFCNMSSADTISISRMGDTVRIPFFYTSLLVTIPSALNYELCADTIKTINPDVCWSSMNYLGHYDWVPNDPYYANSQPNLHPTPTYTNAHINMEPAWDHSYGESFVRSGIFDSGMYFTHADLLGNSDSGFDYAQGIPGNLYMDTDDNVGHGTGVSGITGARTSNSLGISGVAGGNLTPGIDQGGVKIVDMKVGEDGILMSNVLQAYYDGATSLPVGATTTGSLHIFNSSFGFANVYYDYNLVEMIDFVNQNGVAFVASRGNFVYPIPFPGYLASIASPNIPATLKPKIIMNVGANGTDGQWHLDGTNGSGFTSPNIVDFIAPGDASLCVTTEPIPTNPIAPVVPLPSTYMTFGGTSASAPHVTGVAGLMMSYRNSNTPNWDNLVHEDCEYLMKKSATDLTITATYSESVGVDVNTGKGRINAGDALVTLEPQFLIRHIDAAHYSTGTTQTSSLIASNVLFGWPGVSGYFPYAGTYSCNIYKVTTIYSYSFPGEAYLDSWPLYKASKGTPSVAINTPIFEDEPHDVEVVNATISSATLVSYAYKLIQIMGGAGPVVNKYFPVDPANSNTFQVKSAFTLYSTSGPVKIDEKEADIKYFNIYPNPNTGKFTLGFVAKSGAKGSVRILDIMGKTVYEDKNLTVNIGSNYPTFSLDYLAKGIYFVTLDIDNNKTMVKKLIID